MCCVPEKQYKFLTCFIVGDSALLALTFLLFEVFAIVTYGKIHRKRIIFVKNAYSGLFEAIRFVNLILLVAL